MNSEELEVSLRTEFEHYLSGVQAEMKQKLAEFQQKVESEFSKHKSQLDDAFLEFSNRLEAGTGIDDVLKETVIEHLRLARDDGAQLAASAAAEAEKLEFDSAASDGLQYVRDGIVEIGMQASQSAILKSLIDHATRFTERGAFFIIKNDSFMGWHVFGGPTSGDETLAREIKFNVGANTILGEAVRDLKVVRSSYGSHKDDSKFLKALQFGHPSEMVAIPLIARGRGVAVLYADAESAERRVNIDALETLVRVAGLTVELLASSQGAKPAAESSGQAERSVPETEPTVVASPSYETLTPIAPPAAISETVIETSAEMVSDQPEVYDETNAVGEAELDPGSFETARAEVIPVELAETADDEAYLMTEPVEEINDPGPIAPPTTDFAFATNDQAPEEDLDRVEVVHNDGFVSSNGKEESGVIAEAAVESAPTAPPSLGRKADRRVDLPIEVSEDERQPHTKARRFARLLISEIKLYNQDKVNEGRSSNDLYERLREAIDRSREMYDKRVQEPVSSKFDYFHYELVNDLAEGDESRLGNGYPGAAA